MTPGDQVEWKEKGLGRWQKGTLVSHDGRRAEVEVRGQVHQVTASRVRTVEQEAPRGRKTAPLAVMAPAAKELEKAPKERRVEAARAILTSQPKPRSPARSAAYMAYVRTHACCACSAAAPSDPHHWGPRGIGQKTDDFRCVPLCRRCHDSWHDHHVVAGETDKVGTERRFALVQVRLLIEWILRCKDGANEVDVDATRTVSAEGEE